MGPDDELIVIDNASRDRTAAFLEGRLAGVPRTSVVRNTENVGFSRGCNQGMERSSGEFILLLNPDAVLQVDSVCRMAARFADSAVGAVGPVSNSVAGAQWLGHHAAAGENAAGVVRRLAGASMETKLLVGFCMLLQRSALDEVGLLDETLFLGSDDLELSLRLRANGFRLLIALDVFVPHTSGVSFASLAGGQKSRLVRESTDVLLRKLRSLYGFIPDPEVLWGLDMLHT